MSLAARNIDKIFGYLKYREVEVFLTILLCFFCACTLKSMRFGGAKKRGSDVTEVL